MSCLQFFLHDAFQIDMVKSKFNYRNLPKHELAGGSDRVPAILKPRKTPLCTKGANVVSQRVSRT